MGILSFSKCFLSSSISKFVGVFLITEVNMVTVLTFWAFLLKFTYGRIRAKVRVFFNFVMKLSLFSLFLKWILKPQLRFVGKTVISTLGNSSVINLSKVSGLMRSIFNVFFKWQHIFLFMMFWVWFSELDCSTRWIALFRQCVTCILFIW